MAAAAPAQAGLDRSIEKMMGRDARAAIESQYRLVETPVVHGFVERVGQQVAGASQRTVDVSHSGQQAVQNTIASMARIKTRVEGVAENILALAEQTQQIGEIITTVSDIAAQSNMLALNASVESARAGEYGKGFAVVAVEMRNLAEQSKQAAGQVKAILAESRGLFSSSLDTGIMTNQAIKPIVRKDMRHSR